MDVYPCSQINALLVGAEAATDAIWDKGARPVSALTGVRALVCMCVLFVMCMHVQKGVRLRARRCLAKSRLAVVSRFHFYLCFFWMPYC